MEDHKCYFCSAPFSPNAKDRGGRKSHSNHIKRIMPYSLMSVARIWGMQRSFSKENEKWLSLKTTKDSPLLYQGLPNQTLKIAINEEQTFFTFSFNILRTILENAANFWLSNLCTA